ncbi:MAG TPA: aldose epimerase [Leptolyngbya sp.]|nr:aldose epimerase [Leptolyngbya sp.]
MFSIERRRLQFDTYVLFDRASNSKLEIVPDRGGIITSWQVQGRELLYMDTARFADPSLSIRGGIPILFPICGNLPGNAYVHNGQTYTLKQHGFARELPWEVIDQTTDGELSFTIGLSSNAQTLEKYPFKFRLAFKYQLQGQTLSIDQQITNLSDEPMPFSIGFHPYFLALEKQQLRFEIPASEAFDQITRETYPFFNSFDFERDEIDWAFLDTSRQVSHVTDLSRHTRMTLTAADEFPLLVFWTIKGKGYYCLEPWSAPRNALNTGDRLLSIQPGATLNTTVSFAIEFS